MVANLLHPTYLTLFPLHTLPSPQKHNLYLADFPTHDMSADFVLLAEQRLMEAEMKNEFEVFQDCEMGGGLTAS